MTLNDSPRARATVMLVFLAAALMWSLAPFALGLLGAPMLFVLVEPAYRRGARLLPARLAAAGAVVAALALTLVPGAIVVAILAGEVPGVVRTLEGGALLRRIAGLQLFGIPVGAEIAASGTDLLRWASARSLAMLGGATLALINVVIALLGLYFLLLFSGRIWLRLRPYIPFSAATAERLRQRFHQVTLAGVAGTLLTALLQGTVVGLAFWVVGLDRPAFWGLITGLVSVLPVFGSSLVWAPGSVYLLMTYRPGAAATLALIGLIVASNVDNLARVVMLRRISGVHPLLGFVGAFAGVRWLGLVGALVGPLLLAWFFELLAAYEAEYGRASGSTGELPRRGTSASSTLPVERETAGAIP